MTDERRIEKAAAARRQQAARQRQAARQAFEAMVAEGAHADGRLSVAAVAKRAGVSRQLIYSMADLADQIKTVRDEHPARPRVRGNDTSTAETANLKARLAHTARELDQSRKEARRLQRALARSLDGTTDGQAGGTDETERLRDDVARLGAELVAERNARARAEGRLADLQDEHTAARERARELTRENLRLRQDLMAAQQQADAGSRRGRA